MNPELPSAIYGYLLGATLSGGLVLYFVYRLLRKAPLLERVKALARAEEATTIVEFPFALIILVTSTFFVELTILHPVWMVAFLILTAVSFALLGFIIGIWAGNFEQLQLIPLLVITPLVFLGGSFYSVSMLPPAWQTVTHFNPVLYLISGFRWSFFGVADVPVGISIAAITFFLALCLFVIWLIFRTGWRLRQ